MPRWHMDTSRCAVQEVSTIDADAGVPTQVTVGDDDAVEDHGVQDHLSVIESPAMDSKKTELITAMLRLETRPHVLKVFSESHVAWPRRKRIFLWCSRRLELRGSGSPKRDTFCLGCTIDTSDSGADRRAVAAGDTVE